MFLSPDSPIGASHSLNSTACAQTRKRPLKTATAGSSLSPRWPASEKHVLPVSAPSQILLASLHDDLGGRKDAALGRVELPVQAVIDGGRAGWSGWLKLTPMSGIRQDVQGEVLLMISFDPDSKGDLLSPDSQARMPSVAEVAFDASETETDTGGGGGGEGEKEDGGPSGKQPRRRRFSLTKLVETADGVCWHCAAAAAAAIHVTLP